VEGSEKIKTDKSRTEKTEEFYDKEEKNVMSFCLLVIDYPDKASRKS
jgi:hypothetical protein